MSKADGIKLKSIAVYNTRALRNFVIKCLTTLNGYSHFDF